MTSLAWRFGYTQQVDRKEVTKGVDKSKGKRWVKADADTDLDPRIREVGFTAEGLFNRANQVTKRIGADGLVPNDYLGLFVHGLANRTYGTAIKKLVETGLWIPTDDGWEISNWKNWNLTDEECVTRGRKRSEQKLIYWHQQGKHEGSPNPSCPACRARYEQG